MEEDLEEEEKLLVKTSQEKHQFKQQINQHQNPKRETVGISNNK